MNGRVRVLRVIGRLNVGGPSLHVVYLTEGLAGRGYDTTLVAGNIGHDEDSMKFVADAHGVPVVSLVEMQREVSLLRDATAVVRLARLIRATRPHILHTHTAKAGAVGRVAALLAGNARPPIVVHTFHGHVLRGYFDPVRTAVFRRLEQLLARASTKLIAVSPQVRDDLVALGVAPQDRFEVVRLGIEFAERVALTDGHRMERRSSLGIGPEQFVVGWTGRMVDIKRTEHVLLAFRELRASGVDACLCLVGDGPDRVRLERRASELGIMRQTMFVGFQRDVAPYYEAFDVFVLPSANEGTPVSAIEALAAGKPVVATRVGGIPDVVRDGEDGLLADPESIRDLAAALVRFAHDPELGRRMGAAGRERVLKRYPLDRLIDQTDLLYRDLLDSARRRR